MIELEEREHDFSERELSQLLTEARQGDWEAREKVFLFLRAKFSALVKHKIRGADADDVLQETMLVVERHLSEFESIEGLLAYTNEVMRNKLGNLYRRRERQRRFHVDLKYVPEPMYFLDDQLGEPEIERMIYEAIDQLAKRSPLCREIFFNLRDGMTVEEICGRLGISRNNLDDRLYRCRKKLRQLLQQRCGLRL